MTLDTAIRCPHCKAADCRKSKWHSSAERHTHPNAHPYRCRLCSHRFHLRDKVPVRQGVVVSVAFLTLAFVIAATATLLLWNFQAPPEPDPIAERAPIDPYTLRAAQEGDAAAQFRIARILLSDPVPTRENASQAVRWLQSAAEHDHTAAMVELGRLYRSGIGVLQDFGRAVKWIETAAVLGDADGMHELGQLYRDGVGFKRDPVQAYIWFNRSAAALNPDAARDRDGVARGFSDAQLNEAQRRSVSPKTAAAENAAGALKQPVAIEASSSERVEERGTVD